MGGSSLKRSRSIPKLLILTLAPFRGTWLQCHHKPGLIPQEVNLLIGPIGALGTQREIKVVQQFADNKTYLAVSQTN